MGLAKWVNSWRCVAVCMSLRFCFHKQKQCAVNIELTFAWWNVGVDIDDGQMTLTKLSLFDDCIDPAKDE